MDLYQFSLFCVALLVAYVLVHVRLTRCEERLERLNHLPSIDDSLRALLESQSKLRTDRVEQLLDRLHDDLTDLREATTGVRQAVYEIPPPTLVHTTGDTTPVAVQETPGERILALVETRLLALGYGKLRVISDLATARGDREVEVAVECERNGMPCKGKVVVNNGAVCDVAMHSAVNMFP